MKRSIRQLVVGKPRNSTIIAIHDDYATRIRRFGVRYETDWVPEVRADGRYSNEHVRAREGQALLARLAKRGTVIALDRAGERYDSKTLAARVERWGARAVDLVVGGPLGLHRDVLERADHTWSLSTLTFPHEIVALLVAEQVYRALTILRGVPYHK